MLGEKDRVLAVCDALQRGDYETVGKQMYLTHEGLSKDYEVSCDEIDFLVDEARRSGVSGSRIMGGGFGGCTINLVRNELCNAFCTAVRQNYRSCFGIDCQIIPVVIGDGARKRPRLFSAQKPVLTSVDCRYFKGPTPVVVQYMYTSCTILVQL